MPTLKPKLLFVLIAGLIGLAWLVGHMVSGTTTNIPNAIVYWNPPDSSAIPVNAEGTLIRYGRDLIASTSVYLGPRGKVATITNGMNCQNCHLEAGTKFWGNN